MFAGEMTARLCFIAPVESAVRPCKTSSRLRGSSSGEDMELAPTSMSSASSSSVMECTGVELCNGVEMISFPPILRIEIAIFKDWCIRDFVQEFEFEAGAELRVPSFGQLAEEEYICMFRAEKSKFPDAQRKYHKFATLLGTGGHFCCLINLRRSDTRDIVHMLYDDALRPRTRIIENPTAHFANSSWNVEQVWYIRRDLID